MLTGSEVLKEAENDIDVDEAKDEVAIERTENIQDDSADSDSEQEKEGDEDGEELTPHP